MSSSAHAGASCRACRAASGRSRNLHACSRKHARAALMSSCPKSRLRVRSFTGSTHLCVSTGLSSVLWLRMWSMRFTAVILRVDESDSD